MTKSQSKRVVFTESQRHVLLKIIYVFSFPHKFLSLLRLYIIKFGALYYVIRASSFGVDRIFFTVASELLGLMSPSIVSSTFLNISITSSSAASYCVSNLSAQRLPLYVYRQSTVLHTLTLSYILLLAHTPSSYQRLRLLLNSAN